MLLYCHITLLMLISIWVSYSMMLWLCRTSSVLRKMEEEAANIKKWTEAQLSNTAKTQTENRQQLHTLLQDRIVNVLFVFWLNKISKPCSDNWISELKLNVYQYLYCWALHYITRSQDVTYSRWQLLHYCKKKKKKHLQTITLLQKINITNYHHIIIITTFYH